MLSIVNIGGKNVPLEANGATPIRYKMTFKSDLMVELNQMNKGTRDEGELLDIVSRLAFVMSKQAANDKAELATLNQSAYLDWVEGFGTMDIANAAADIMGVYMGQTNGDSTPKKEAGQVNEN